MPKISSYAEDTFPDPTNFIVIQTTVQDQKYKTPLGNLAAFPYRKRMPVHMEEFMGDNVAQMAPFTATAMSTGTFSRVASETNHPGIWRFAASAAGNAGYVLRLGGLTSILFQGGEVCEFIGRIQSTAGVVLRMGFHDTVTTAADTDGACFILSNSTSLEGRVKNNGTSTSTATSYTITTNTWYRFKIEVSEDESLVTFYVYDTSNTLLWSDTCSSNIPTARHLSLHIQAYRSTASAANLFDIDWLTFYNNKAITR